MAKFYNDEIAKIEHDMYYEILERRGLKFIKIVRTKNFSNLLGAEFQISHEHHWSQGDSFWKLSQKYFGDPTIWWTLALLNKKPTDNHCKIGDVIYIPKNIYRIAEAMR